MSHSQAQRRHQARHVTAAPLLETRFHRIKWPLFLFLFFFDSVQWWRFCVVVHLEKHVEFVGFHVVGPREALLPVRHAVEKLFSSSPSSSSPSPPV